MRHSAVQVAAPEPAPAFTSNLAVVMGADGPRVGGLHVEAAARLLVLLQCARHQTNVSPSSKKFTNLACDALANAETALRQPS